MDKVMADQIRIVVFKEGDVWVAQCLEYDICTQAPTTKSLRRRINATIDAERDYSLKHKREPFAGIGKAPKHFFDMWEKARWSSSDEPATGSVTRLCA